MVIIKANVFSKHSIREGKLCSWELLCTLRDDFGMGVSVFKDGDTVLASGAEPGSLLTIKLASVTFAAIYPSHAGSFKDVLQWVNLH